jgi:uncharacterized protein (DUF885 family)
MYLPKVSWFGMKTCSNDLEVYFRQPGYGMNYVAGKQQIERRLAARAQRLGDKFDLGKFHDQFLAAGMIPVALTEWEMTGTDIDKEFDRL